MTKQMVDLSKMQGLLAEKSSPVIPASDALQRGSKVSASKDEMTNLSKDEIVNLSFKVPSNFRKRFKLAAVNTGITQNELVQQALIAWEGSKA